MFAALLENPDMISTMLTVGIGGVLVALIGWVNQSFVARQKQNYEFIVRKRGDFRGFIRNQAHLFINCSDLADRQKLVQEVNIRINPFMEKEIFVFDMMEDLASTTPGYTDADLIEYVRNFTTYDFNRANIESKASLLRSVKLRFFEKNYWLYRTNENGKPLLLLNPNIRPMISIIGIGASNAKFIHAVWKCKVSPDTSPDKTI